MFKSYSSVRISPGWDGESPGPNPKSLKKVTKSLPTLGPQKSEKSLEESPKSLEKPVLGLFSRLFGQTAKSTHHPHKTDDQHRECKTGGGAYFSFLLGSDNSHTTPPKIPPDEEGLLWGWCVVRGPLLRTLLETFFRLLASEGPRTFSRPFQSSGVWARTGRILVVLIYGEEKNR